MSKFENPTTPADALGRVASSAYRYSDHSQYLQAVKAVRDQEQSPSSFDPKDTSYSYRQGDAEHLVVYYPWEPTNCIIEYRELAKTTLLGLQFSYQGLRISRNYQGVESPTASPRGIRDAENGTYRAVLLYSGGVVRQLEGVIINPPYPFLPRGKALPGAPAASSSTSKYLLPVVGVALVLFWKPIMQGLSQLLHKRDR